MSDWEDVPSAGGGWEDVPETGKALPEILTPEQLSAAARGPRTAADVGLGMFSGIPAQITGGLSGIGSLMMGQGADKAADTVQQVQKYNFGAGEYKPFTKEGATGVENVSGAMEKPVEWAMHIGEKIGGNEGAYIAELLSRALVNLGDPAAAMHAVGGALKGSRKAKFDKAIAEKQSEADALKAMDKGWEDVPDVSGKRLDIDLSQGTEIQSPMPVTPEGQGIVRPEDAVYRRMAEEKMQADRTAQMSNETQQLPLFDHPDEGRPPMANEAVPGDWRIDENGMPIKADLSMEAANLENPLQRNLFGDELAQKHPQEADRGITQAMDHSRQEAALKDRQEQINMLSHDLPAEPRLERAKMDADIRSNTPRSENPSIRTISPGGRQTGAVASTAMLHDAAKLVDKVWQEVRLAFDSIKIHHKEGMDALDHLDPSHPQMVNFTRQELKALGYGDKVLDPLKKLQDAAQHYKDISDSNNIPMDLKGKHNIVKKAVANIDKQIADLGAKMDALIPQAATPKEYHAQIQAADRSTKAKWRNLAKRINELDEARTNLGLTANGEKVLLDENVRSHGDIAYAMQGVDVDLARQHLPQEATPAPSNVSKFVPRSQRGGISPNLLTLGLLPDKNPLKKLAKEKDGTYIERDPTPEELEARLKVARSNGDGKSATYMDSGAHLAAMKRGSEAIRIAAEVIGNAGKRAELQIVKNVFPAENAIRKLNKDQLNTLGEIFKKEMFAGKLAGKEQLEMFSPKIQNAYRQLRDMFHDSLDAQNAARVAKGQKPITPVEAYLSSRWQGDFRRPLYDKNGKLVWYLAANNKMNLNAQTRAVLKDHPDLTYDPKKDHTVRFWNRKTDLEGAYTTMLDILGRDDPSVAVLQKYMEDQTVGRGATFLNQEKHFKAKGNIHGFVGDRPELKLGDYTDRNIPFADSITVGNKKHNEMIAMFEQQMQYAKNAYRWSEMQKAGESIKRLINDPELVENQPNNIKYIREYFKNAIGYGESKWARITSDTMRDLGVSPKPLDDAVGGMKSYFILTKLAANAGYATANAFQLAMTFPHMVDLFAKGYRANPLRAYMAGTIGGLMMGTGHIANSMGGHMPEIKGFDFFNSAAKYAEDNGITARSIYDEAPVSQSFSALGQVAKVANKTMTVPETMVRSMAFMSMAQYLKDTGKFKTELDVFREAERRTNIAMVDYASSERPMIFSKLGTAGNMLNTLQTFSWNYMNQMKYFWNESTKGNFAPLLGFIGMQYLVAGTMGVPGVEDMYQAWMKSKDMLPPNVWRKMQSNDFLSDPKLYLLEHGGTSATYGYLSDKTGLGMTSRLAAPSGGQMLTSPAGPIMDIGKQIGSVASLAMDPMDKTKQAQAAMDVAPTGVKGLLETAPFMENHTFVNRHNDDTGQTQRVYGRTTKLEERTGLLTRTPEEENMRKWGFGLRKQTEVVKRDVNYSTKRMTDAAEQKANDIPTALYDAIRNGDKKEANEYFKTYIYITGEAPPDDMIEKRAINEYRTDTERQKMNASAKQNVMALQNVKRMKDLFDALAKENKDYAAKQQRQGSN